MRRLNFWTPHYVHWLRFSGFNVGEIAKRLKLSVEVVYAIQNTPEDLCSCERSKRLRRIRKGMGEKQIQAIMAGRPWNQ